MKFIFVQTEHFYKILCNSHNPESKKHKKRLEKMADITYETLDKLESSLKRNDCYIENTVSIEIHDLPHTIKELPVLYQWSPKAGHHGYSNIGKIKIIDNP